MYEGPEVVKPVWCFHGVFHQPSFNYSVTDYWNLGCLAEFMERMKKMQKFWIVVNEEIFIIKYHYNYYCINIWEIIKKKKKT